MASPYDPSTWYWVVAGSGTHVYSSASQSYVAISDASYVAWLAAEGGNTPTPIATEALLYEVLNPETPSAIERDLATGTIDPTDGGPWTFTGASGKFFPIGGTLYLRPFADQAIAVIGEVKAYDGTDLTVSLRATNATVSQTYDLWSISLLDAPPAALPLRAIVGLQVTQTPGSPHSITIEPGSVIDSTGRVLLSLESPITKDLTAVWAAGDGNGGAIQTANLAGTVTSSGNPITGTGTAFNTDFAGTAALDDYVASGGTESVTFDRIIATSTTTLRAGIPSSDTALTTFGNLGASGSTYRRGGPITTAGSYLIFFVVLIRKDTDGSIDAGVTSATPSGNPDLPSGYTLSRVIARYDILVNATPADSTVTIAQPLYTANLPFAPKSESFVITGNPSTGLTNEKVLTGTTSVSVVTGTGSVTLERAALTGDVTASANSNSTTIANDAVTNAKLANMAAYTIKGRNAGTTGDPSDIDISALTEKTALVDADLFIVQDSAASNAFKKAKRTSFGFREKLTADRTYYVRTDGSDSNTGLVNNSGGAWLTWQKAWDYICANLDLGGYTVTVQIGDGTYAAGLAINKSVTGGGSVVFQGNTGDKTAVINTGANGVLASVPSGTYLLFTYMKFNCATSAITAEGEGVAVTFNQVDFGTGTVYHLLARYGGLIQCVTNGAYAITGGAGYHMYVDSGGLIISRGVTVTVTTALTYTAFAFASSNGSVITDFSTWSNTTATGLRYSATLNGVINSGGATYPGGTAGTTATGGQYT